MEDNNNAAPNQAQLQFCAAHGFVWSRVDGTHDRYECHMDVEPMAAGSRLDRRDGWIVRDGAARMTHKVTVWRTPAGWSVTMTVHLARGMRIRTLAENVDGKGAFRTAIDTVRARKALGYSVVS